MKNEITVNILMCHTHPKNGLHRLNIDFKVKKSLFYDYGRHNLKNTWIQDLRPIANDSARKTGIETLSPMS